MASFLFTTFLFDAIRGDLKVNTDSFAVTLLDASGVSEVSATFERRSEVIGQVNAAVPVSLGVTLDAVGQRVVIDVGQAEWTGVTVTAAMGAVIYKDTGAASSDRLVAFVEFDTPITVTGGDVVIPAFEIPIRKDPDA